MNQTSELLGRLVRRAARRLTVQRAFRVGVMAGNALLAVLAAAAVAALVIPLSPVEPEVWAAGAAGIILLVTAFVALVRPVAPLPAAQLLDRRAGLEERTSTALEVARSGSASTLTGRLLDDATMRATALDLRRIFPWRLPRGAWMSAALALFLIVWPSTLRGVAIPGTPADRAQRVIRREGGRLEQFARSLQSRTRAARMPQTRRVAPQVRDLGTRLQQERLDRAGALARIAELSRQLEQSRREIDGMLRAERRSQRDATIPQELFRQAVQQQIRQLRELTTRLRQDPEAASQEALQRLGEMTRSGEGSQPAQVRQQLQRAQEQLQQGNRIGAGESLTEALRELEGIASMLADEEGLRNAEQQLQRSHEAIASAGSGPRDSDVAEDQAGPGARQAGPGDNPPTPEPGAEGLAPEGPHEGTTAGQGRGGDKMGQPSARLQGERSTQRLRGAQSEGPVSSAEVIGAGRPGVSRQPVRPVSPAIVAQADRAMEASRTPGRYRALVRRYFQRLARLR